MDLSTHPQHPGVYFRTEHVPYYAMWAATWRTADGDAGTIVSLHPTREEAADEVVQAAQRRAGGAQ